MTVNWWSIDKLSFDTPKTSQMAAVLKALGLDRDDARWWRPLIKTTAVYKSGRNICGVTIQPVRELNALSILSPRRMLVTKDALDRIKDGTFTGSDEEAAQ